MEFDFVVKRRKSVRSFTGRRVDWRAIMYAIEAANHSPFAGNHNNLKFLIIEDEETIKKISKSAEQSWISHSPTLVLVCSDDSHLENLYGERGRIYSRQQAGAAIQALLLKLTDLNLSSCWVGAYSDEIIKQNLKIPQNIQIEAIITVGYEDKKSGKAKPHKKSLESAIYWEQWGNDKKAPVFKEPKEQLAN